MVKKPDGTMTTTVDEMAETLFNTHFPNSSRDPVDTTSLPSKVAIAPHFPWINVNNFQKAVQLFKNDKAAGPDNIKPIILKNIPTRLTERLCNLYAACLESGYTPSKWRHSRVIFIPKPGKDDYSDPNAFRPISLTSFIFKTMERLVLWHLETNMHSDVATQLRYLYQN
jgi:hypothetical protein